MFDPKGNWTSLVRVTLHAKAYIIDEKGGERLHDALLDYEGNQSDLWAFIKKYKHSARIDMVVVNKFKTGLRSERVVKSYWVDFDSWL